MPIFRATTREYIRLVRDKDMMRSFLIFSAGFDEDSGGQILLHKLCHILNQLGRTSSLTPMFESHEISLAI